MSRNEAAAFFRGAVGVLMVILSVGAVSDAALKMPGLLAGFVLGLMLGWGLDLIRGAIRDLW